MSQHDDDPCPPGLRTYARVVGTAAVLLVVAALVRLHPSRAELEPAFLLVCGLVLLTEVRPLRTGRTGDADGLTLSALFVFAVLLRYGLPAAVTLQAAATLVASCVRRRPLWRAGLGAGEHVLSWGTAAVVLQLAGRPAGLGSALSLSGSDLPAAAGAAMAWFVCRQLLLAHAARTVTARPRRATLRTAVTEELLTSTALLSLSPLVCLAVERGASFVPLLLPPLLAVYAVGSVAHDHERSALSDALTGLGNRVLFQQRAAAALRDGEVALVLFDLDRFKEVNDTLGHHVGDRLLQVVAERLTLAVRPCDTVARLGGDEFALVLPGLSDPDDARVAAERLRHALSEPIVLEGLLLDVGASAGVAVSPRHGTDAEVLLQHADNAMYLAKESGDVEVYDPSRDCHTPSRLSMLGELRLALETDQLALHFQPAVSLAHGEVVRVEALVRWQHPVLGLVGPADFVPLAERSGLVHELTAWVLDAALAQLAAWQVQGLVLSLAVNISIKDLCGEVLAGEVEKGLARHGIDASRLQLEVTEGSLLADPGRAATTLRRLAELGVALSLDDFGTGSSSLSHLRRLPVREVKVDRSFVDNMVDPTDLAVVRSVVDLGRGLGMTVVAEGVEDALTFHRLAAMGCDVAQGWFVSPALPADELTRWLRQREIVLLPT